MQHPRTDASSSSPHWGEKEQTMSAPVLLMNGTVLSQNLGILASEGNSALYDHDDGRNNMSYVMTG